MYHVRCPGPGLSADVIQGFLLGGLYALLGIGMTIIMGVMKIINLAHGELMMVAMYIAFVLFSAFHIDPYLSVVVAAPALFLLGIAIQKFLINPVLKVDSILPENQVILTVGIGMVLANIATIIFKSDYRQTPVDYWTKAWYLSDIWRTTPVELSLSLPWTVSFVIAVLITVALWFFLTKTDMGKSIRATAQDPDAATLMGVNVQRMRMITFGLGSALVGAAGCLFIPIYYIYPDIGGQFTLIAFVITILGGLGIDRRRNHRRPDPGPLRVAHRNVYRHGLGAGRPVYDFRRCADLPSRRSGIAVQDKEVRKMRESIRSG